MIKVIHADQKHRDALYELWQECFHDPVHYANYYFQQIFAYNDVLAVERDGHIVSMLHLNPYEIFFNGHRFLSRYIVGVATHKNHRHRGYMSMLLRQAFTELYATGTPFVYLMPVDPLIYTPSNFAYIYKQFVIEKKKSQSKQPPVTGGCLLSKRASRADIHELISFANRTLVNRCDVFAWRDKRYYENLIQETAIDRGAIELLYDEKGLLVGYVAYVRGESLEIREVMTSKEWESHVLHWISHSFSGEEGTVLTFPISTDHSMGDPSFSDSYYKPIIMARIVHLKAFLNMVVSAKDLEIVLDVRDPWIRENNGKFIWTIRGKGSQVHKMAVPDIQAASAGISQVTVSVQGLAAWIFGYKTLKDTVRDGEIFCSEETLKSLENVRVMEGILLNEIV